MTDAKIVEVIERLERLRDEVVKILEDLETVYFKLQDEENERKTSKEINEVREQVDQGLGEALVIVLAQLNIISRARNIGSEDQEKAQHMAESKHFDKDERADNRVPSEERRPISIDSLEGSH